MERRTRQREAIRQAIETAGRPVTPQEILEAAQGEVPNLGLATVYRAVRQLGDEGSVVSVDVPGQPARYEPAPADGEHHHHFRCTACEKVYDIEGCPGGLKSMVPPGFTLSGHEIWLFGECAACSA